MRWKLTLTLTPTAVWGFHVGVLFRSTVIIIIIIFIWHLPSLRIGPVTWDHYFRRLSGDPTLGIFHDLISYPPNRIFWDIPPPSGGKIEKWTFNVLNFQEEARLKQLQELEAQKEDDDYKNTPEGKLEEKLR